MPHFPNELLYTVVMSLASAVVVLWRLRERDQRSWRRDQKEASRLIFALLGRLHEIQGTSRSPMTSIDEWDEDTKVAPAQFDRAKKAVNLEFNGEIERLVKAFLDSDPPSRGEV